MLYPCVVLWNGRKPNLLNVDFFVGLRPCVSVQDHKMKTKTSPEMAAVYLTCDSSRTFSCKSQWRNSLTIDSDSLISLMAPYHSLRWMDVRGCARSNIVTSSPYWLNIQYECIMTHCSPHSSYIRARQNETCCCFTLWSLCLLSLATFEVISCCTNFLWCLFATVCVDFHKSLDSPFISLCFPQKTAT